MSSKLQVYQLLDKVICHSVNDKSVKEDLQEAAVYHALPAIQEMNTEFSPLDTKASALISHLSLMVAAIQSFTASFKQLG